MTRRPSSRRSLLGGALSASAALWVALTGLFGAANTGCEPTAKYGGPPPPTPTTPIGPIGGEQSSQASAATPPMPSTTGAANETAMASSTASATATPVASGTSTATEPIAKPKYGGPPPMVTKYGAPRR